MTYYEDKANEVAKVLEWQACEIRWAAKLVIRMLVKAAKNGHLSLSKDGPGWDKAVKILRNAAIVPPDAIHLSWKA